jgi:hypothetical protein
MAMAISLILLIVGSSFLGLSCGKNAEISCHSCGYPADGNEDIDYIGLGIHGSAVDLSHIVHLLFVAERLGVCSLHPLLEMSDGF